MSKILKLLQKDKTLSTHLKPVGEIKTYISTNVLSLNVLFSGRIDGGIGKGYINQISADSSLGKSLMGLSVLRNAQKQGMECIVIDSERSFDYELAKRYGIDTENLPIIQTGEIHKIKQTLQKIANLCETREDRQNVFVLFDSWGRLVSAQNLEKAEAGSTARDMALPFWKNELANIMAETDFTYFVINHIYSNTGGFGDPIVVPGGKRLYFNSDSIVLCIGASKAKDGSNPEVVGKIVTAKVKKGRGAVEEKKLKFRINHQGGLCPYYGMLDDAIECGVVTCPKQGWYARTDLIMSEEDKNIREKDLYTAEWWEPIIKSKEFIDHIAEKYSFKDRHLEINAD